MRICEIVQSPTQQRALSAPLYHGTDLVSMMSILRDDSLHAGAHWGRPGEPHGVRLTRDPRIAWNYGDAEITEHGVLVFDQGRLRQRYRIVPYRDVDHAGDPWSINEMEEVVLTDRLPVSPFLVQIRLDPTELQSLRTVPLANYVRELGLFKSRTAYFAALDGLARHPLVKPTRKP